jgi:cytochrome b6
VPSGGARAETSPPRRPSPFPARTVVSWFRTRLDIEPALALLRRKPVPIHRHSWIYCLGDAAVFLFAVQAATGLLLMLYYQPTEAAAHESVRRIVAEVPCGWLIRSIHVWGASLFLLVVGLHLATVLFARAYRRPRELVWISGVVMLFVAMGSGFSGYLLPWTELSYFATRVGTQIPGKLPGIGPGLVHFLRGSEQLTGETITRFFAGHVAIAPLAMFLLLWIHVFLSRVRGVSLPAGLSRQDVRDYRPFFSEFLLIDLCFWLVLLGAIVTLAVLQPAGIGVKADPLQPAPEGIKPEWYFLFMLQTFKLLPEMFGIAVLGLAGAMLLVLPFLERGDSRAKASLSWTVGFILFIAYVLVFTAMAWIAPGPEHPQEDVAAGASRLPGSLVSLALVWLTIGFLIYYLQRLLAENARIRKLYAGQGREEPEI